MIFLSLILSLWLEQYRALPQENRCYQLLAMWTKNAEHLFFAGEKRHAYLAWFLAVLLPCIVVLGVYTMLGSVGGLFGSVLTLGFSVLVLYLCLGFRQFSDRFSAIQKALLEHDHETARQLLAQALGRPKQEWSAQNMANLLMQTSVPAMHIHVLGVMVAYTMFALLDLGPTGAVLYRLAYFVYSQGNLSHAGFNPAFKTTLEMVLAESSVEPQSQRAALLQALCARTWYWVNWVPLHATILAFAAVGSFENTIGAWRSVVMLPSRASRFDFASPSENAMAQETLLLTTAAAALSVNYSHTDLDSAETTGSYSQKSWPLLQPEHLQNLVALGWRALLFWLFIAFLIALARFFA